MISFFKQQLIYPLISCCHPQIYWHALIDFLAKINTLLKWPPSSAAGDWNVFLPLVDFDGQVMWAVVSFGLVGLVPIYRWRRKLNDWAFKMTFIIISRSLSADMEFHNPQYRPRNCGFCVANHTSPIDIAILSTDCTYSLVRWTWVQGGRRREELFRRRGCSYRRGWRWCCTQLGSESHTPAHTLIVAHTKDSQITKSLCSPKTGHCDQAFGWYTFFKGLSTLLSFTYLFAVIRKTFFISPFKYPYVLCCLPSPYYYHPLYYIYAHWPWQGSIYSNILHACACHF